MSDRRAAAPLVLALALAAVGCGGGGYQPERDDPRAAGDVTDVAYALAFRGREVGWARQELRGSLEGWRLTRREEVRLTREGHAVDARVRLTIDADRALRARRVEVEVGTGALERRAVARRGADGRWTIEGAGGTHPPSATAEPLELALVALARAPAVGRRRVLLAGAGFAEVAFVVEAIDGPRVRAALVSRFGREPLLLERDGATWRRIASGELEAVARPAGARPTSGDAIDAIAAGAIALPGPITTPTLIALAPVDRAPPALPAQRVVRVGDGWRIEPTRRPALDPSRHAILAELIDDVDRRLDPAFDAPGAAAPEALRLGRADCTGRAALFVALARKAGIDAAIVTGYRVDGERLVRHRWIEVAIDDAPVWIDPSYREVPAAPGALIGLVRHGDDDVDLAESALFGYAGLERARASVP